MNKSEDKIARGVSDVRVDDLAYRVNLLLITLRAATVWERLVYLLTKRIPLTEHMKMSSKCKLTSDSYDDWRKY